MIDLNPDQIREFIQSDIPTYQRGILIEALNKDPQSIDYYDKLGKELTGETSENKMLLNTGPEINKTSFWSKVKHEVYLYICTEDEKYTKERNLIGKNFKEGVTIMATAIAATFSLGTGVVVGIITTILISIAKINKNAWCALQAEENNAT